MKMIRPRETRLFIDDARALFTQNPYVFKVIDRRVTRNGEEMDMAIHKIENFDTEFASNFFYRYSNDKNATIHMMMVPLKLNGDE